MKSLISRKRKGPKRQFPSTQGKDSRIVAAEPHLYSEGAHGNA